MNTKALTTEKLPNVQRCLLQIAKEIKRVCDENHIRYFLYRGSLLGAVRHQGFIPWDDDMDIAMLREDYEQFRQIAPKALGEDYCFQDWHNTPGYAHPFGKVRMRGTRYVEAKCRPLDENGIYVDVYPLDFVPRDNKVHDRLIRKQLHLYRIMLMKCRCTPWREGSQIIWKKRAAYLLYQAAALFFTQKRLVFLYENASMRHGENAWVYEQSGLKQHYVFSMYHFENLATYLFEGELFNGPADADFFLRYLYDDYRKLPDPNHRENRHQIIDLDFGAHETI